MSNSARWGWIVAIVAATGVVLVLAFVVSFSTQGGGFYERHFVWLFWVNVAVAAAADAGHRLAAVRLAVRVRRGKFGSRLLIKLAGIFALVGRAARRADLHRVATSSSRAASRPGSTSAWPARSMPAWTLGRGTLDALVTDLATKTRVGAERLADAGSPAPRRWRSSGCASRLGAAEVALVGPQRPGPRQRRRQRRIDSARRGRRRRCCARRAASARPARSKAWTTNRWRPATCQRARARAGARAAQRASRCRRPKSAS